MNELIQIPSNPEFNKIFTEFQNESERAAAILAAAFLDELLKELLLKSFVDESTIVTDLVNSQHPLGSFSARISVAYAFGIIDSDERFDLDQVREIRNKFAHRYEGPTFNDQSISDKCNTFKINSKQTPSILTNLGNTPRNRFTFATFMLIFILSQRISKTKRIKEAAHYWEME